MQIATGREQTSLCIQIFITSRFTEFLVQRNIHFTHSVPLITYLRGILILLHTYYILVVNIKPNRSLYGFTFLRYAFL